MFKVDIILPTKLYFGDFSCLKRLILKNSTVEPIG